MNIPHKFESILPRSVELTLRSSDDAMQQAVSAVTDALGVRDRTNLALRNMAEIEAARRHWMARVLSQSGFGSTEIGLARRLAETDQRVARGLEVRGFAAAWGRDCGFADGDAIGFAIPRFETAQLVDVIERGRGMRPWCLILRMSVEHWQEVARAANDLLQGHLLIAGQGGN